MARVDDYADIIKRVLREYADLGKPEGTDVEVELIFDDASGHYELRFLGWQGWRRLDGSVLHLDLRGDKVWIQHDGTNLPVAEELLKAGIPSDHIVLGFHHPSEREHTEFAVA